MIDESKYNSVSKIFITRPVMTMLLALASIAFGIYAYRAMPVNDLPGVDYPVIQVNVSYPGADPTIMGANVASPLEQQFMQIPGIQVVTSKNNFGSTQIVLQFALNKNIDAAATDVQSAIQRAMGALPRDLPSPPSFTKDNPNDMPIYIVTVTSRDHSAGDLYDYAFSQISQRLNMVEGVSKVDIYGAPNSLRLEVDTQKLYNLGFTMTDLKTVLSRSTNMTGIGNIEGPSSQFVLFPDTQLSSPQDYEDLVIGFRDGAPIFLKDIAKAITAMQYDTLNLSFHLKDAGGDDGLSNITLGIRKRADSNAISTVEGIKAMIEILREELPASINLVEFYDRSILIIDNIEDVKETLLIAFCLVILVIFLFLGRVRDTIIPTVAMPFSILLTFIFMWMFGFSLNNLSLMALTMAIGFLVDDAIVFLENTVRRMEDFHESPRIATLASAKEISFTILSMTLSLAAVFIPLVFMSGITGRVFLEFSITIITATLMSGVVSLTLTPMMCSRILQGRTKNIEDKTAIEKVSYRIEKMFLDFYSPTLYWMLKRHFTTLVIIVACIFGSVYFAMKLPQIFFPTGDSGFMQGGFITNTKSSSKELKILQDEVSKILKTTPGVKNFVLISGVSAFVTQNIGFGFIILDDKSTREPINQIADQINARIASMPGVLSFFKPEPTLKISTGATSDQMGKYSFTMAGMNQDELYQSAQVLMMQMAQKMNIYFSSIQSDLFLDNPQITLKPHKEKAAMMGLTVNSYSDVIKDAYAKFYYYLIKSPFQQYWSIMEARPEDRSFEHNLSYLQFSPDATLTKGQPVGTLSGSSFDFSDEAYTLSNLIPFDAISTFETELRPLSVNHFNNFPSVTISFDLIDGVAIGDVTKWMNSIADEVIPNTISKGFQGEAISFQETMRSIIILIFVAIFVMYIILGILYESYLHPVTVLISLPIAVVGGLFSLWVFDMELSIYSAIGLFMLMGIVKKNGIMIVDFAIAREKEGRTPYEAVHEACMERFRPIIMTTIAALVGMLPIAFGWGKADAESRIPLGVVVVGGLIFSQLVTLYVTPVVYLWIDWFQTKVLDKIAFFERGKI